MKVAIHQPQYWPWPGYIHKALSAEVFVYLDTVQFSKNGYQNRNQVKTPQGAAWLTLPVRHQLGQSLAETRIADGRAPRKHARTIAASYASTAGYRRWKDEIEALLSAGTESLSELAIASTEWMLDKLGATCRRLRASDLRQAQGRSSQLVASICRELRATEYLTGTGALDYMEQADFAGIRVLVQDYGHLEYEQVFPEAGFVGGLSTLDLLLSHPDDACDRLTSVGGWRTHWER